MPRRKREPLTREGEPRQTTIKGLEIPVPRRGEFDAFVSRIKKAAPRDLAPTSPFRIREKR
jgi:hypothetical protein